MNTHLHNLARKAISAFTIAFAVTVLTAVPKPSDAAPSALHIIQSIVKRAIADAPRNFASIRDETTAYSNTALGTEISKDFKVSPAIQELCATCDMGISDVHRTSTTPEYWEFNLGISLGTIARDDVPAFIRKSLSPVIPASYKYAGAYRVDKFSDEVRWNAPNGLLIRVSSELSGFGPNKRVAVIYVRHTP